MTGNLPCSMCLTSPGKRSSLQMTTLTIQRAPSNILNFRISSRCKVSMISFPPCLSSARRPSSLKSIFAHLPGSSSIFFAQSIYIRRRYFAFGVVLGVHSHHSISFSVYGGSHFSAFRQIFGIRIREVDGIVPFLNILLIQFSTHDTVQRSRLPLYGLIVLPRLRVHQFNVKSVRKSEMIDLSAQHFRRFPDVRIVSLRAFRKRLHLQLCVHRDAAVAVIRDFDQIFLSVRCGNSLFLRDPDNSPRTLEPTQLVSANRKASNSQFLAFFASCRGFGVQFERENCLSVAKGSVEIGFKQNGWNEGRNVISQFDSLHSPVRQSKRQKN